MLFLCGSCSETEISKQLYYILAGKPTADPKRWIYLFDSVLEANQPSDYSLWNVEFVDEHTFRLRPYKGEDSFEPEEYQGKEFVEHAFEGSDKDKNDD